MPRAAHRAADARDPAGLSFLVRVDADLGDADLRDLVEHRDDVLEVRAGVAVDDDLGSFAVDLSVCSFIGSCAIVIFPCSRRPRPSLTLSVTALSSSCWSPSDAAVPAVGSATCTPWFFVIDSETMMNVASRKKMMSMSGMISIRASPAAPRAGPRASHPPIRGELPARDGRRVVSRAAPVRGACRAASGLRWPGAPGSSSCGPRRLELVVRLVELRVQEVERQERRDRDAEAEGRGDQRLGDAARDRARRAELAADQRERAHHARDRAEQAEQRRQRDHRVEDRDAARKRFISCACAYSSAFGERLLAVRQRVAERATT
jgi:hypothetical protein